MPGSLIRSPLLRTVRGALLCLFALALSSGLFAQSSIIESDAAAVDAAAADSLATSFPGTIQPGEDGFVPLTASQRTSLFFKGYLGSPLPYYESLATSGGQFIVGEPEGWPRTSAGYAQRAGTAVTLLVVEEGVHEAGDAALGLDPRYYRCRCSGLWRRTGHAFKMTFLAYDSLGHLHLDTPRLVGDYGGSMLVTSWYPSGYASLVQGVQMGHAQVGYDAGINLLREFTPELKRFLHRIKRQ